MAAVAAGCSRKLRQSGPTLSGSAFVRTFYVSVPSPPEFGKTPSGGLRASGTIVAAATKRIRPILDAFNATHVGLRATPAPLYGAARVTVNPVLSAVFDAEYIGANLRAAISAENWNPMDLWPGLIETVSTPAGDIVGLPVNVSVTCVTYNAAAMRASKVAVPFSAKWTEQTFLQTVLSLAQSSRTRQVFGPGLGFSGGQGPAWLGYATGYGGAPFSGSTLDLTSPRVMNGLEEYPAVLRNTWQIPASPHLDLVELSFISKSAISKPATSHELGIVRFPAGPVSATVPAVPRVAAVPVQAPDSRAGMAFVLWLLSRKGQLTLTRVGFPSMRMDVAAMPSTFRQLAIAYADLVFVPGALTFGIASRLDLDYRIAAVLATTRSSGHRLRCLQDIQRVTNQVVSGSLSLVKAMRALDSVVPAQQRP